MKAILVSFFNSNNLGDVLIGETLNEIVSSYFEVENISYSGEMIVSEKVENQAQYPKGLRQHFINIVKKNSPSYLTYLYYRYIQKVDIEIYEKKIKSADVLVIGGGNMIFDLDKNSLSGERFNKFIDIAKENNKKIFAISLGIGPFLTNRQLDVAISALEKCDYITFRDEASYNLFNKYSKNQKNVSIAIDPVFLLSQVTEEVIKVEKKIGLNIINGKLINQSDSEYLQTIQNYKKLIDNLLLRTTEDLVLFSTETSDYEAVCQVYDDYKDNKRISLRKISNSEELLKLYEELSVLIGTRMHSMIIAYTQRVPVIGLYWQQKVISLFEIINDQESVFNLFELDKLVEDITTCLVNKKTNLDSEIKQIDRVMDEITKKNDINLHYLDKLLNE